MTAELESVRAEADAPASGALVVLTTENGDFEVTVPPPGKWKTRANAALRKGDFDEWAALVLSKADLDKWLEADPVNDDVEAFFRSWQETTGEDRGKSRPSANGSRGTRRR